MKNALMVKFRKSINIQFYILYIYIYIYIIYIYDG